MRLKEKNLYSAPKRPARTRLYEPTQGTAQIGSLEKSYKLSNYTAYIQKKKNENEILCVHYGRWHAHDLTSEQVLGRATSNFVWKRLVRVKKSLWILGFSATSIKIRHRLFKSWIAPTNCVIQWIVIYPMDSAIHLLNNWDLKAR